MSASIREVVHDIRHHPLLTVRALTSGWVALLLLWALLAMRLAHIDDWLFAAGLADIRTFWRGGSAPFPHLLIGGVLNASAGWLVGRLHRRYKAAMVSAFFVSFVLLSDARRVIEVEASRIGEPPWRGLALCLLDFTFMTVPILVAGIWGVRDPRPERRVTVGAVDASV